MRCLLLLASVAEAVRRGHSHTPFDQDPFVFDPKGRLLQLDYADAAASKGAPCVGLCANNIAVLAAINDKIADVDARHAMTFAGVRADGYALVDFVRVHAARERLRLPDEAPATRALALALADECHTVCIGGGRRAYGCRCLLAGLDFDGGACLWSIGPGGDARKHMSGVAAVGAGLGAARRRLRRDPGHAGLRRLLLSVPGRVVRARGPRLCPRKPPQLRFNMTSYESMRATFVSRSRELVPR